MTPDFSNTAVAFASRSDKELKRAHRLFSLLGKPTLMRIGKAFTMLAFRMHLPIKGIVKRTIFSQFCGGEHIQECEQAIDRLNRSGIGTILDYSVEGKEENSAFEATADEILRTIAKASGNEAIPFSVFKVTGIARFSLLEKANDGTEALTDAERQELEEVEQRIDRICKAAHGARTPIFMDAEDSWIQNTIDRFATTMMERYNTQWACVYNTVQLYRHDRLEFLKASVEQARSNGYTYGVKLVRGAYMEKERARAADMGYPSPIQPNKEATDRDFDAAVAFCVENLENVAFCAGTHNEESSAKLAAAMEGHPAGKAHKHVYFAQLLGMSDHISYNLAASGFNVAKYVPYGPVKEVLPYLMRRAEENTSVSGQTGRELTLIRKELRRRKQG
jgi:proline dehydrogenase